MRTPPAEATGPAHACRSRSDNAPRSRLPPRHPPLSRSGQVRCGSPAALKGRGAVSICGSPRWGSPPSSEAESGERTSHDGAAADRRHIAAPPAERSAQPLPRLHQREPQQIRPRHRSDPPRPRRPPPGPMPHTRSTGLASTSTLSPVPSRTPAAPHPRRTCGRCPRRRYGTARAPICPRRSRARAGRPSWPGRGDLRQYALLRLRVPEQARLGRHHPVLGRRIHHAVHGELGRPPLAQTARAHTSVGRGRWPQKCRYLTLAPARTSLISASCESICRASSPASFPVIFSIHASLAGITDTPSPFSERTRHWSTEFRRVTKRQQRNHLLEVPLLCQDRHSNRAGGYATASGRAGRRRRRATCTTGQRHPERFPAQEYFADGAQFIAGRLTKGTSGRTHAVVDPATGEDVYTYELAGTADVDAAVAAARAAFPAGRGATPGERSDAMHRFAAVLAERADDLARARVPPVRQAPQADPRVRRPRDDRQHCLLRRCRTASAGPVRR